jgi:hypothetical protein
MLGKRERGRKGKGFLDVKKRGRTYGEMEGEIRWGGAGRSP